MVWELLAKSFQRCSAVGGRGREKGHFTATLRDVIGLVGYQVAMGPSPETVCPEIVGQIRRRKHAGKSSLRTSCRPETPVTN